MLNNNTSNKFYREDLSVEYAKSNRSECKVCNKKIEEGEIRIGHSVIFDPQAEFFNKQWYHLECVKLPPRLANSIAEDFEGIEDLNTKDIEKLKKTLGVLSEAQGGKKAEKPKIKHVVYYERVNMDKMKPKDAKAFTPTQFKEFKQLITSYSKKSSAELKSLLVSNNQRSSGDKLKLATRCAQFKLLGVLPNCPECGGQNIKFDIVKDSYFCPGYLDDVDWVNCQTVFKGSHFKREEFFEK